MTDWYLGTDYDRSEPVDVEPYFTDGLSPAIRLTEGLVRRPTLVARCVASHALLGLRNPAPGQRLLLTLEVSLDQHSARFWDRYVPESVPRDQAALPRVVLFSVQGSVRCAVLLAHQRHPGTRKLLADVRIEIGPEEIPAGDLILLELQGFHGDDLAHSAPVGISVVSVGLSADPVPDAWPGQPLDGREATRLGLVSTGGLTVTKRAKTGSVKLWRNGLVANPGPAATLTMREVSAETEPMSGPARVLRKAERAADRLIRGMSANRQDASSRAVDLVAGTPVPLQVRTERGGDLSLEIPARRSPIFITLPAPAPGTTHALIGLAQSSSQLSGVPRTVS